MKNFKGIFVTGTDTDIGKTVVSAILMLKFRGTYWKPIQTGKELGTDTQEVRRLTRLPEDHFLKETYNLFHPLSPHLSAKRMGIQIDLARINLPEVRYYPIIVEGAGGILVPLNERDFMIDLIKKLGLPVILVASTRLGTINHTLLSLYVLRKEKIKILGVILNGPKNLENKESIERFGKVEVLAEIEPFSELSYKALSKIDLHKVERFLVI